MRAAVWMFVTVLVGGACSEHVGAQGLSTERMPTSAGGSTGMDMGRLRSLEQLFQPNRPSDRTVGRMTAPQPRGAEQPPTGPVVKCGMTLIPLDPHIDPGMVVPRPPDATRFALRAVDPPLCR